MNKLISVNKVSKSFKNIEVLNNVSFDILEGDIIGLVGLNGAGKSTLISIILDLIKPNDGTIAYFDNLTLKDIGVMLQEVSMPINTKVTEMINMIRTFSKNPKSLEEILEISELGSDQNKFCNKLSGGKQRRLQFALSIANNPKVLFLDEPTVGMDFESRNKFWDYIKGLCKSKLTVILTSHDLHEIEDIANRVIILNNKSIIYDNDINSLKDKSIFSRIIKINNNKSKEKILDNIKSLNQDLDYKESNGSLEIYTNDVESIVNNLKSLGIPFDDFEIKNIDLEYILNSILKEKIK